jgi:hypothetical protein
VVATEACEEVMHSDKFRHLLELVLLLGNYLNSGSRNEQALGFDISFLPKVRSMASCLLKKIHVVVAKGVFFSFSWFLFVCLFVCLFVFF